MNRQIEEANRICDEMREIASNQHNYGMLGKLDGLKDALKGLSPQGGEYGELVKRLNRSIMVVGGAALSYVEHLRHSPKSDGDEMRGADIIEAEVDTLTADVRSAADAIERLSVGTAAHAPKEGWVSVDKWPWGDMKGSVLVASTAHGIKSRVMCEDVERVWERWAYERRNDGLFSHVRLVPTAPAPTQVGER